VGLEQLPALVLQVITPRRVVIRDARVQDEVVVPSGDSERVELDRPESAEDFEHRVGTALKRARGREHLTCDEKAPCRFGSDVHGRGSYPAATARASCFARIPTRRNVPPSSTS
jgi:hypothetical protein